MYKLVTLRDVLRIPPDRFGEPVEEVALEMLRREYEEVMDPDLGIVISVIDVEDVGVGRLIPGDGGAFHQATFRVLTFKPEQHEVVEGAVTEVVDFGVFVRLGPVEGLIHISQLTDDFIDFDSKTPALIGKETGRRIMRGDMVRARVVSVSMSGGARGGRIGLTMRQPFLGKIEWIKEELERIYGKQEAGEEKHPS
ncbi:MAG: DNA-directed RNA polymerase [Candidatus Freyarchaeota archaeon]|nr:DNA-directed RNA polymerase [Candidatus Freyrarchaeum guaymaensis]